MICSSPDNSVKLENYEIGKIADELVQTPLPVIFFTGLNIAHNTVHYNVWTSFSCSKKSSDRLSANYTLITSDSIIPQSKQKKSSYDWYVAKGILKRNWMVKHLHQIPSVIVVFFELDWDNINFTEKSIECASLVESIENKIENRNCRVALVLLQKNYSIPMEDGLATERATSLLELCKISATLLFVLPYEDQQHFYGYIIRMECAFHELANGYYQQEIKLIRNHKEQLNKTTHGLLFVRHQFKIAFFSEMRRDPQASIKAYKQAYVNLMEIRPSITNIYEIMTIAGFVNYKICKLLFQQNDPRDAVSQFQKHVNIFRSKEYDDKLLFEYYAWMGKQFAIFGEIFDLAIESGLVANQTQHPGFYFYEAVLLFMKRKKAIEPYRKILPDIDSKIAINMIEESLQSEFYGQRPWRAMNLSLSPLNMEEEEKGIQVLQYHELKHIDYLNIIVRLLQEAMSQFRKNKCPRMMRFMVVLIGKQYYETKDYVNCLTHLNQVLPSYRAEGWKNILVSLLITALSSAYLSANDTEFVKFSLEFICSWVNICEKVKIIVQESVFCILNRQPPLELPIAGEYNAKEINNQWSGCLNDTKSEPHYFVKMNNIVPFIEVKPMFIRKFFDWQETVIMNFYVLLNTPKAIKLSKLSVIFNEYYFNQFCDIICEDEDDDKSDDINSKPCPSSLYFEPKKLKCFQFKLKPRAQDSGKQLKIIGVSIALGEERKIFCDWIFDKPEEPSLYFNYVTSNTMKTKDEFEFLHIIPCMVTTLQSRKPKVIINIDHNSQALLNENYSLKVNINNNDCYPVNKIIVTINRIEEDGDSTHASLFILNNQSITVNANYLLTESTILPNSSYETPILYQASNLGVLKFGFVITYCLEAPQSESDLIGPHTYKEVVNIQVNQPYSVDFTTCNPLNLPSKSLRFMEPFILRTQINSLTSFSMEILDVYLNLDAPFFHHIPHSTSSVAKQLEPKKTLDYHFILYCDTVIAQPQCLGKLSIKWRRSLPSNLSSSNTNLSKETAYIIHFELPQVTVGNSLLFIETHLPDFGVTRKSSLLTYYIHNRTDADLPIHFTIDSCDNIMFSGNRSVKLNIPPKSKCAQHLVLYPLVCGQLTLPKIQVTVFPDDPVHSKSLENVLSEIVPTFWTVYPQEKKYQPMENNHLKGSNSVKSAS